MFRRFTSNVAPATFTASAALASRMAAPAAFQSSGNNNQGNNRAARPRYQGNNNRNNNNNNNNNRGGNYQGNNNNQAPAPAPGRQPRVEISKVMEKKDAGGRVQCSYVGDNVIMNWNAQVRDVEDAGQSKPKDGEDGAPKKGPLFAPVAGASLWLTPLNTAKVAGVLEGVSDKVELHSRTTKATVTKAGESGGVKFECSSSMPSGESVKWGIGFDAAETLMLHRFLIEAIHANHGFRS